MVLHKVSDQERSAGGAGAINATGWEVRTRVDDEKVGKVDDVLIEDSGEARFLDVDLGLFSKRVLVPVERTSTDSSEEVVWVIGFDKGGFEGIPEYEGDVVKLNADYREGLLRAYSTAATKGPDASLTGAPPAGRTTTDEEAERVKDTREASPSGDTRLGRVDELDDYEVADHHLDVRGWDVVASDDRKIGDVKELVADTVAMKVRYLEVELESDFRRSDEEGLVLVPIEHARFVEDDKVVRLNALASHQARNLPAHGGTFDRDYQARVSRILPTDPPRNSNDPRR